VKRQTYEQWGFAIANDLADRRLPSGAISNLAPINRSILMKNGPLDQQYSMLERAPPVSPGGPVIDIPSVRLM
jgi:hypothetical protein